MTTLEDLMQAALVAPADLKDEALRVLRGQARTPTPSVVPAAPEPYLTQKEVAQRLGLDPCTLRRWQVPGHCLGGRRRFKLSEVVAYLEGDAIKRRVSALRAERRRATKSKPLSTLASAATGPADANTSKPGRQRKGVIAA